MAKPQFILILSIIGYCLLQETEDECQTQFYNILKNKCAAINTGCSFDILSQKCIQTNSCSEGNGNQDTCHKLVPPDFHKKKCKYDSSKKVCEEVLKECRNYGIATPHLTNIDNSYLSIDGDICEDLSANDNKKRCVLISTSSCEPHYNDCSDVPQSECNYNKPKNQSQRCVWSTPEGGTEPTCHAETKSCNEEVLNPNKDVCSQLKPSDSSKKACIYNEDYCSEEFISCESYNTEESCEGKAPLTSDNKEYNYNQVCYWDSNLQTPKCKARERKCKEYPKIQGLNADICKNIPVADSNKRCAYDSVSEKCYEEYSSCKLYNDNEVEKSRAECQNIKLEDKNKECIYIDEDNECLERTIYTSCEEYPGDDKKICESIVSSATNSYCVLDKDSKCQERTFYCSEAFDEYECLHYAKAIDTNKTCAYNITSKKCYEEYKNCEDYTSNDTMICSSIKQYSQKKCEIEENECKPVDKKCSDAKTKEECKLIAKSGVDFSDKKVCDFDYHLVDNDEDGTFDENILSCFENYKYCSDYRGDDYRICNQIKPYDKEGNETDITSKCKYDANVGCQRVHKDCEEADGNPILCAKISAVIKEHDVKYCAYIDGYCKEYFTTCEEYDKEPFDESKCLDNIPENYLKEICKKEWDSVKLKYKCVTKKDCGIFKPASYETICREINVNCAYSEEMGCIKIERSYSDILFYKESEENEAICKSFELSEHDPNKNSTLTEDKKGCEWVYNEPNYIYLDDNSSIEVPPEEQKSNYSQFLKEGIGISLILCLFCLLI